MKRFHLFYFFSFLLLAFSFASCTLTQKPGLRIAAAANMQFALHEITETFTAATGIPCQLILSSSGKLSAQIAQGAPFDIFLSANLAYPRQLFESGHTTQPPSTYAFGKLVLWSLTDSIEPAIELLDRAAVKYIALANPKTAPYGRAAVEALRHFDMLERVESRLVYAESIAQANQFITSRAATVGFTAKSVVLSPALKAKGRWLEVDPEAYAPIEQGVVILKNKKEQYQAAQQFYNFLFSGQNKEILNTFGYSVPE